MATANTARGSALAFHETEFDVVDLHGQPWLRLPQIEGALGYAHGGKALSNLYERNAAEFTDDMTQVLELPTAGGVQPVRIFSLRGAHLLGMLARTERAAEFRRWVLDVLEGREAPLQAGTMTFPQQLAFLKERRSLVHELGRCTEQGPGAELYANLQRVSRLLGMGTRPLKDLAPGLKQMGLPGAAS